MADPDVGPIGTNKDQVTVTAFVNPQAGPVAHWLDQRIAPDWRLVHRLRSMQVASFWAIVAGLWVALPAFQNWLEPVPFACVCVGFSLAIMVARLTKQPGLPDV